jgi:hypothetical protein
VSRQTSRPLGSPIEEGESPRVTGAAANAAVGVGTEAGLDAVGGDAAGTGDSAGAGVGAVAVLVGVCADCGGDGVGAGGENGAGGAECD